MAAAADFESLLRDLHSTLVTSGTVQTVTEQFSQLKTDLERVQYLLQMPEAASLQQVTDSGPPQSVTASEQLRSDGNACFGRGEHVAALRLYSQAAQSAPPTSPQLGLALANRSATLFQLGRYAECEEDVQRALQHGYPAEMRYKLYERLGEARRRRGNGTGAERAFCTALKHARNASLDARRRKQLLVKLDGLVCRSAADRVKRLMETGQEEGLQQEHNNPCAPWQRQQQGQNREHKVQKQYQEKGEQSRQERGKRSPLATAVETLPTLSQGQRKTMRFASAAIDVVVSEDRGRMLVANRDLVPGDVVIVEPPLSWATLPDSWGTHCYQCCGRLEKAVPCVSCSSVQFCSERCRAAAVPRHALECGLLERLLALDVGPMALLALRLVAAAGPGRLRQQRLGRRDTEGAGAAGGGAGGSRGEAVPPEDPLEAARGLVGHTELRSVADLFRRTATAVCLACLLHSQPGQSVSIAEGGVQNGTSNGEDISTKQDSLQEGFSQSHDLEETAAGLLHFLQSLPCNAHEVSEHVQRGQEADLREVGAAVYPTVSLLNHSCDPNVLRVSYGTTCVVRVIRKVSAGEELLDNYGFHWAVQGWPERQQALKRQYYFDCHCVACSEDWMCHDELPEKEYFVCDLCDAPPRYCYHEKDAGKVELFAISRKPFLKAMEGKKDGGKLVALDPLVKHLMVMDRVIAKPSREYNNCQEAIKLHFFAEGNCYQESENVDSRSSVSKNTGTSEALNCIERLYGKNKRVTA